MKLLAKNKIANYIEKHPQSRIELLLWLQEFPYREGNHHYKQEQYSGNSTGLSTPGGGDYAIKYQINHEAEIIYITWIGSKEEVVQEFRAIEEKHPELVTKSVEVVLVPPPPIAHIEGTNGESKTNQTVSTSNKPSHQQNLTAVAYLKELERSFTIINAAPKTPHFQELLVIAPLIQDYETYELNLPPVYPFEFVALRMNLFQLKPADLATMTGSTEDEINHFLAGRLTLQQEMLGKLYKHLGIRIPA
jgi:antitoxin component HigA of HigAB toxin-antitoxin module/mRNA-degrading endonuclease HigB of HigAB toxin-antitoxin module